MYVDKVDDLRRKVHYPKYQSSLYTFCLHILHIVHILRTARSMLPPFIFRVLFRDLLACSMNIYVSRLIKKLRVFLYLYFVYTFPCS